MASLEELDPPIITLLGPIYEDTIINNPGPYNIKAQITDESGIFMRFYIGIEIMDLLIAY